MQIGKSFTYAFEDAKWFSKLLIGAIISIVPILNFAWGGYTTEIMRRVFRNDPEPLADWDDFGRKFMDGLILVVAGFIYALPFLLLTIPLFPIFFAAFSDSSSLQDTMAMVSGGLSIVIICLLSLYGLFLTVFFPAVQINFAHKGSFGSCFEIGAIIKRATGDFGNYLLAWLMYLVFAFVIGLIGGTIAGILAIIPCIGWILSLLITAVMTPLIGVVYAHLFGQAGA